MNGRFGRPGVGDTFSIGRFARRLAAQKDEAGVT
jgi:hypothetical protein